MQLIQSMVSEERKLVCFLPERKREDEDTALVSVG